MTGPQEPEQYRPSESPENFDLVAELHELENTEREAALTALDSQAVRLMGEVPFGQHFSYHKTYLDDGAVTRQVLIREFGSETIGRVYRVTVNDESQTVNGDVKVIIRDFCFAPKYQVVRCNTTEANLEKGADGWSKSDVPRGPLLDLRADGLYQSQHVVYRPPELVELSPDPLCEETLDTRVYATELGTVLQNLNTVTAVEGVRLK